MLVIKIEHTLNLRSDISVFKTCFPYTISFDNAFLAPYNTPFPFFRGEEMKNRQVRDVFLGHAPRE